MPPAVLPTAKPKQEMTPSSNRNFLADVISGGRGLPSRTLFHAAGKVGKTSMAAHAPGVVFLMSPGETGLETLIDAGQIGDVPHFPEVQEWNDVKGIIEQLTTGEHQFKTLVLDTMNGLESLLIQSVCKSSYSDDMVTYSSYNSGAKVSVPEWKQFLFSLDRLREERKVSIFCLCHSKTKTVNNVNGLNYDRWQPTFSADAIWDITYGWMDTVMFGNFHTTVKGDNPKASKGKAKGGTQRSIFVGPDSGWASGSRYNLPDEIDMGDSGKEAWDNFADAMKSARTKGDVK